MSKFDKPPKPMVRRTASGIFPLSGFDAEEIDAFPIGQEFDMHPRARRSGPLHRTYWKTLSGVVKATDLAPTTKSLHRKIKRHLGYTTEEPGFDGEIYKVDESTAFDAMKTDAEFRPFFDKAIEALCQTCGYDVLAWLDQ